MRHTTFRFALDPTPVQAAMLVRHAGASRFAFNQCHRLVTDALTANRTDPHFRVPWSGFDLINAYNAWKGSEAAGRVFSVARDGATTKKVTGLAWRHDVSAQVFEEAAVDFGRALAAYGQAKAGKDKGQRVGFPRKKRKGRCRDSFRLRNKRNKNGTLVIRIGEQHPRSVTLPKLGTIRVHDDTRRLRRLLHPVEQIDPDTGLRKVAPLARILFITCSRHGSRWYISLNVQAPDFHPERRHQPGLNDDSSGFVGVDRGLAAFAVVATAQGTEVGRYLAPRPLQHNLAGLRRRSRAASRTKPSSRNHVKAIRRLSRQHARISRVRRSFLHEVSSQLVKTHDRLCLEGLAIANLVRNKHLARAIGDAAWAEFARQVGYKAAWFGAELVVADRWFPSTKTCSCCGKVNQEVRLAERVFCCHLCGLVIDRDRNAATNLATWAQAAQKAIQAPARQAGGRVTNAPGGEGAGRRSGDGETGSDEGGTDAHAFVA